MCFIQLLMKVFSVKSTTDSQLTAALRGTKIAAAGRFFGKVSFLGKANYSNSNRFTGEGMAESGTGVMTRPKVLDSLRQIGFI